MSVATWANKVAEAMRVMPPERPSFAAVLVEFIDEYDELAAKTKLKIPVFARALTTAGLTSASGGPCDPDALRMQIKRARGRRLALRTATEQNSASVSRWSPAPSKASSPGAPSLHTQAPRPSSNVDRKLAVPSVLKQLQQSKPKKVRPLDGGEDGI
jgi:hypothetical protein